MEIVETIPPIKREREPLPNDETELGKFLARVRKAAKNKTKRVVTETFKDDTSAKNRRIYIRRTLDRYMTEGEREAKMTYHLHTRGSTLYAYYGREDEDILT